MLIATVLTGRSAVASYAGEEAAGSLPELDQQIISEDSSIDGGDTNGSAGAASDGSADTADDNQEQAGTALSSMQACLEEAVTLDPISGADAMSDQGHQDSSSPGEEKKTEESGNAGTEESIDGGTAAEGSQEETVSEDKSAEEEPDQNEKADNTNGSKETDRDRHRKYPLQPQHRAGRRRGDRGGISFPEKPCGCEVYARILPWDTGVKRKSISESMDNRSKADAISEHCIFCRPLQAFENQGIVLVPEMGRRFCKDYTGHWLCL